MLMEKSKFFLLFIIINVIFLNSSHSQDIPIIVISPGKTIQSYSTTGSAVSVIDNEDIEESQDYFLADVLNNNSTGINLFQMGGQGTNAGIQLRGFAKRYSTVYIDGVKMSDPSSTDNSFYSENIMKHSIDRVEILRGAQSSLYGSSAIGGTVNIFTKKGKKDGGHKFEISDGSNNSKNVYYSINGATDKSDFYLGLNKFVTDGISAMNDNNEDDKYRNDGVVASYGYKFNENLKVENNLRYTDAYLNYDAVNNAYTDLNDSTDNLEGTYSLKFIYDKNNIKNIFSYNKTYIERNTVDYAEAKTTYYGFRDAINLLGEYNFNLDNKIIYGLDNEFDGAKYPTDNGGGPIYKDEAIFSQYLDYQFRPLEKVYSTIGLRRDKHTTAGKETSGRATVAYKFDNNTKIRSSFGTGIRFPSLYDYFYGSSTVSEKETLKAEKSKSYDIGYETYLDKFDLGLNISYFKLNFEDPLVSQNRTGWMMKNATGKNTSEGIELGASWKTNDLISTNLNYTYTDSFSSSDCENPDKGAGECNRGSSVEKAMVRVPRHAISSSINYKMNDKFRNSFLVKYIGETRDYGNTNNSWVDVILDDYATVDLVSTYNISNNYDLNFSIRNMFDQEYEQAHEYSSMARTLNFSLKRKY